MSDHLTILVGDRFDEFGCNPYVQRISAFLGDARRGAVPSCVILGQGVSRQAIAEIAIVSPPLLAALAVPEAASCQQTHKRFHKNIMISNPCAKSAVLFEASLLIDDSNEVMEDHQTGQHIQGLALIEAARQMWTAVTEDFLLPPNRKCRFVIANISSTFTSFVFPLPCTMTLEVLETTRTSIQTSFFVRIQFCQGETVTTTIEASYLAVEHRVSVRQEAIAARRAVEEAAEPILAIPL